MWSWELFLTESKFLLVWHIYISVLESTLLCPTYSSSLRQNKVHHLTGMLNSFVYLMDGWDLRCGFMEAFWVFLGLNNEID